MLIFIVCVCLAVFQFGGVIGPKSKKIKHKIVMILLSISLNMCFGCSKELSHRDSFCEYPQQMFWLRNKKNSFQLHTLIWGPGPQDREEERSGSVVDC